MSEYPNYGGTLEVDCRIVYPQIGLTDEQIAKRAAKRKGKAKKYNDKKVSITALIKKSDKAMLREIQDACTELVGVDDISELEKWPLVDNNGDLRDGDDEVHAENEGYAGCVFFKVGTDNDIDMALIDDDGEVAEVTLDQASKVFYPGANCLLVLQVCEWDEGQVTFYLKGILRLDEDGKRLGTTFSSTSIFQKRAGGGSSATSTPVRKKKAKKVVETPVEEEDDDDDEEEEEEAPKPKRKRKTKKVVETPVEEEDDDEEEEEEAPKPKRKAKKKKKADISSILD